MINNVKLIRLAPLLFSIFSAELSLAEGTVIEIEGARIRGNQELPNVLYIVPWQAPKLHKLDAPESTLAERRTIKKLERGSFKRLVSYHRKFLTREVSE